jgi:hypothetical protein
LLDRQIAFWATGKSKKLGNMPHNKALHQTAVPLRSIAAGELCRCAVAVNLELPLTTFIRLHQRSVGRLAEWVPLFRFKFCKEVHIARFIIMRALITFAR